MAPEAVVYRPPGWCISSKSDVADQHEANPYVGLSSAAGSLKQECTWFTLQTVGSGSGNLMIRAAFISILYFLAAGCAATTPQILTFAEGLAAYNRGDHAVALTILEPLASKQQPEAAYILGEMYAYAQGVPKNYSAAYDWYLVSGRLGNPRAQMVLGHLFEGGLGVARSYRHSLEWYQCVIDNEESSYRDRTFAIHYMNIGYYHYKIEVDEVECRL